MFCFKIDLDAEGSLEFEKVSVCASSSLADLNNHQTGFTCWKILELLQACLYTWICKELCQELVTDFFLLQSRVIALPAELAGEIIQVETISLQSLGWFCVVLFLIQLRPPRFMFPPQLFKKNLFKVILGSNPL